MDGQPNEKLLKIERHSNLTFKIPNLPEYESVLRSFFVIVDKMFDEEKKKNVVVHREVFSSDKYWIYIPFSLVPVCALKLKKALGIDKIICDKSGFKTNFSVRSYWKEFFSARKGQWEGFVNMCKQPRGVVQLPTGSGKSEYIIAVIDSVNEPGNRLVVVPFNSIKAELAMRFKKRGIIVPEDFDPKAQVNIINAPGYKNSSNWKNPECIKWMNNVVITAIDECENISESLGALLQTQLTNSKYIYGFSASADKVDGKELSVSVEDKNMNKFSSYAYSVLSNVGMGISYTKPRKKMDLHIIKAKFGEPKKVSKFVKVQQFLQFANAEKAVIEHPTFKLCLKMACEKKRKVLFMPVRTVKMGEYVRKVTEKLGYNAVLWHSGHFKSDTPGIKDYESLKRACEVDEKIDVIIATKVAFLGIDIKTISDVLLVMGTMYNMLVQPIGRAFRYDYPSTWLLQDMSNKNPLYNNCHFKRLKIIKETYEYEEFVHQID